MEINKKAATIQTYIKYFRKKKDKSYSGILNIFLIFYCISFP